MRPLELVNTRAPGGGALWAPEACKGVPPLSKYSGVSGMGFPRVTTKTPTPTPTAVRGILKEKGRGGLGLQPNRRGQRRGGGAGVPGGLARPPRRAHSVRRPPGALPTAATASSEPPSGFSSATMPRPLLSPPPGKAFSRPSRK